MGNRASSDVAVVDGVTCGRVFVTNSAGATRRIATLTPGGNYMGAERALMVRDRLNSLFSSGANLELTTPGMLIGQWVVQQVPWGTATQNLIVTATAGDCTLHGDTPWHLALYWANQLRSAIDRPPLCDGGGLLLIDAGKAGLLPVVATLPRTNATYYGYETAYNQTASGECWHPYDHVCAMWAINPADTCNYRNYVPFGTYIRVTNLNNGLQTLVRVVDRGPRHDIACGQDKFIDLSQGAAEAIGFQFGAGSTPVRLEQLS